MALGRRGSPTSATRSRASSASRCRSSWTAASARRLPALAVALLAAALLATVARRVPYAARLPARGLGGGARGRLRALAGGPGRTSCATSTGSTRRSLALVGAGLARALDRSPCLAVPWPASRSRSPGASAPGRWRAPGAIPAHAERVWEVPSLDAPIAALQRATASRSAYASLQFAGRLTLESRGAVIASQAWNERIPGDPLRFRDEVDLDPRRGLGAVDATLARDAARRRLPRAACAAWAARVEEDAAGSTSWCSAASAPPYDESRPVPRAAIRAGDARRPEPRRPAVLDRDPETAWTSADGARRAARGLAGAASRPRAGCRRWCWPSTSTTRRSRCRGWRRVGGEVVAEGPARARPAVGERRAARGPAGAARDRARRPPGGRGAAPLPGTRDRGSRSPRSSSTDRTRKPEPEAASDRERAALDACPRGALGRWPSAPTPRRSRSSPTARRSTPPGREPAGAPPGRRVLDVESLDGRRSGAGGRALTERVSAGRTRRPRRRGADAIRARSTPRARAPRDRRR